MRRSIDDISRLREAFDRHAEAYDSSFSRNPLAGNVRERTWAAMDPLFPPGSRVLDLGCGTGEDAIHHARRGVSVRAVDLSERMVERTREKARLAGVTRLVECSVGDYSQFARGADQYDGMYSNFGALNSVADLGWLAEAAAGLLKPGAPLVLVLMSRFYPLQFAADLLKGRLGTAVTRWRSAPEARIAGIDVVVHYHRLGAVRRVLEPRLILERSEALCLFTPVPGLDHLNSRFPDAFRRLRPIDLWLSRRWPMSGLGDHFMSVWRLSAMATELRNPEGGSWDRPARIQNAK